MEKKMSYSKVINNSCLTSRYSFGILMPPPHTKGAGLLECFQCVETLVFVSKHTEGMSLRCDAPLLIVAGMNYRISSRLTQIPRDSTRRLFVEICVNLWF